MRPRELRPATGPAVPGILGILGILGLCAGLAVLAGCASGKSAYRFTVTESSWPVYGGTESRTHAATSLLAPPFRLAWEYEADAGFGGFSAVAADTVAIVATLTGEVHIVGIASGDRVEVIDFEGSIFGTPALADNTLFVGISGPGPTLVAYSTATHSSVWQVEAGAIESSPLLTGEDVIVSTVEGRLACHNRLTGEERWSFKVPGPVLTGSRSSPAKAGDLIVFGADDGTLHAVSGETGALAWTARAGKAVFAAPSAGNGKVMAASLDGNLYAFDSRTGEAAWKVDLGSPLYGPAACRAGRVYAATSAGSLWAIDEADGTVIWTVQLDGSVGSAPLAAAGLLYVGDLNRNLYCIDANTGRRLWQTQLEGRIRAAPIIAGGKLIVEAEDDLVLAFEREPGQTGQDGGGRGE